MSFEFYADLTSFREFFLKFIEFFRFSERNLNLLRMSCSAYYFGHGNDPKIKEIRQKYDVIEERIRKYHEKSQVSNSVNELYGTNRDYFASSLDFSSKRVEKTHKNQDLLVEKQLALLKDVIFLVFSIVFQRKSWYFRNLTLRKSN